jgi:hypothetical protein
LTLKELTVETLVRVYGHHSPDHLKAAADAITGNSRRSASVVESVIRENHSRAKAQKSQ